MGAAPSAVDKNVSCLVPASARPHFHLSNQELPGFLVSPVVDDGSTRYHTLVIMGS